MPVQVPPATVAYLRQQIPYWYNTERFPVAVDPLGVVHAQLPTADVRAAEAAAFFAALFAWGRRDIAIAKTNELLDYLLHSTPQGKALRPVFAEPVGVKHRTFTNAHMRVLVLRLQDVFDNFGTLQQAFSYFADLAQEGSAEGQNSRVEQALNGFRIWFFEPEWVLPVARHVASPDRGSACKRLNLMLRWLCRPADTGLDCGLWTCFSPAELVMPLDVHVLRSARHFGLLHRATPDWLAALELTEACRQIVPEDPLLMDFVLFGLSQTGALDTALVL